MQEVNVGEIISRIEPAPRASSLKQRAVTCYGSGPVQARVIADRGRLQQILLNLLGNAIKFTDTGIITVSWTTDEVTVRICVQDTGCGVPANKLSQIFEPFEQATRELKTREGVGLGLAISRELAYAMGGDITVQSTLGEGADIHVEPPMRPDR